MSSSNKWTLCGIVMAPLLLMVACGGTSASDSAGSPTPPPSSAPLDIPPPPPVPTPVCEARDVYTVCVSEYVAGVSPETIQKLKDTFFDVYPALVDRFNHSAPLVVNFLIEKSDKIALADGSNIVFQSLWFHDHPGDLGVVAHEAMHIVQHYRTSPAWLQEGIADYARYWYGVNNQATGWKLQPPAAGDSYTGSYAITARFLVWVEERYTSDLVDELDVALRGGSYAPEMWVSLTGKSVDDLWAEYVADPDLASPPPAPTPP